MYKLNCKKCCKSFDHKSPKTQFCSPKCWNVYRSENKLGCRPKRFSEIVCRRCGCKKSVHYHKRFTTYCSKSCSSKRPRSKESRDKQSITVCGLMTIGKWDPARKSKKGFINTKKSGKIFYASLLEKRAFELWDEDPDVSMFYRPKFAIEYLFEGSTRRYLPDALICRKGEWFLVEVKRSEVMYSPKVLAKSKAACAFCYDHGYQFLMLTESMLG